MSTTPSLTVGAAPYASASPSSSIISSPYPKNNEVFERPTPQSKSLIFDLTNDFLNRLDKEESDDDDDDDDGGSEVSMDPLSSAAPAEESKNTDSSPGTTVSAALGSIEGLFSMFDADF